MCVDIILCIEASHAKGMGHAFRALRLALGLREAGISVTVVGNDNNAAADLLRTAEIAMRFAPTDSDSCGWELPLLEEFRPKLWLNDRLTVPLEHAQTVLARTKLGSIDDRGEGGRLALVSFLSMPCMFVPSPGKNTYMGVEYLILAPEFRKAGYVRDVESSPRILVSMGGSDTWGATVFIVNQLVANNLTATVVTGPVFAHEAALQNRLAEDTHGKITRLTWVSDFSELFAAHDLLICAGGLTPFEAASAGLPCITLATEAHEVGNAAFLDAQGIGVMLGERREDLFTGDLLTALRRCQGSSISEMSKTALQAIDGKGLMRVTHILSSLVNET